MEIREEYYLYVNEDGNEYDKPTYHSQKGLGLHRKFEFGCSGIFHSWDSFKDAVRYWSKTSTILNGNLPEEKWGDVLRMLIKYKETQIKTLK